MEAHAQHAETLPPILQPVNIQTKAYSQKFPSKTESFHLPLTGREQ